VRHRRRLLVGDRVPAIADALLMAQSTVRSRLSAVCRKLRVNSPQQLVGLLWDIDSLSPDT